MESNFYNLIEFVYNFLCGASFTAFGVTLSLWDVSLGLFLLGLVWFAIDKILD